MKKNILNIWFEKSIKILSNQIVVFLVVKPGDYQKIKDSLKTMQYHLTIINVEELRKLKNIPSGINQIIISEGNYEPIENMKSIVSSGIIYIEDVNSINKFINLINNKFLDENNEIKYELIQKIDFESLFKNEQINIQKFVLDRLYLLEKINSKFEDIDVDFLLTCLKNYHEKKILLASFAQLLYRLANLDFTSTTKKVGGNIREILGVKSSTINRTRLVGLKANQFNKNFRVYNLNENTFVTDEKIRIAEELVKLDSKDLDITKISKITELPLKKVETMYREAFLD